MEIRISVFTPEPSNAKEFRFILNDLKRQRQIINELTEYICSVDEAVVHFGAFDSEKKFVFGHNFYIPNTENIALINRLLKSANIFVITGATIADIEEIIKENREE